MKFTQNKISYNYLPKYYKQYDELNINRPKYSVYRYGAIKQNKIWKDCLFYIFSRNDKTFLEIYPVGIIKDGMSDLGPVNNEMFYDKVELSLKNKVLLNMFDLWFSLKIKRLKLFDRITPIKSNLFYILLAFVGSFAYYVINYYFDNFLQKLINNSILAQSIIVFLTLSSIINIFHPFTLRRELNVSEIDDLIKKKSEKMKTNLEHDEWVKKQAKF